MSDTDFDVLILGAGMPGAASAAQLALRGKKVALIDRQAPGEGTSYGNAGIIDPGAFVPIAFPRKPSTLVRYALGLTPHLNFHPSVLPKVAGWLYNYYRNSSPEGIRRSAGQLAPFALLAASEHRALSEIAGVRALIRDTGLLVVYRSQKGFEGDALEHDLMRERGLRVEIADEARIAELEPHLKTVAKRGAFMPDAWSTSDPGALTKAYAEVAFKRGGRMVVADAGTLTKVGDRWQVGAGDQAVTGDQVVVALGPWSKAFLARFGIDVPIVVKRGYHMHYSGAGNATLNRPISDGEGGFAITPMAKGIRMTTGAEFAEIDAPPTPVQLGRAEEKARELFPIERRLELAPWMGRRPNTYDSVPIIGKAPGQPGMWLATGHGHWGLGLGAVTGRLVAELVSSETPVVDPSVFRLERFG